MPTARQELLLERVVQAHVSTGIPVGSKTLAEELDWASSTIRSELAQLEELGLLAHPHTSAGRVPTHAGYRFFVDRLLPQVGPDDRGLPLSLVRHEVDEAMRATTEALSQVTDLLAVVTAPPLETATLRHVEVLLLQPQVLMVVVITSTGAVTKRILTFDSPVDTGLADWAKAYLNEQLVGLRLGARAFTKRLTDPALGTVERDFLEAMAPAFSAAEDSVERSLWVDGAARLLSLERGGDVTELNELMALLERRVELLAALRDALGSQKTFIRIGPENAAPALRRLAVVAQGYGVGTQTLGVVSVLGPVRMDYARAIRSVRAAAGELSRFVEDLYETA